jgi:hypothetical protein
MGATFAKLGDDVLTLEGRNRSRASRILVRPMIKSLFNLAAAVRNRAFAAEKYVAELEDHFERIKKWIARDEAGRALTIRAVNIQPQRRTNGASSTPPGRLDLIKTMGAPTPCTASTFIREQRAYRH